MTSAYVYAAVRTRFGKLGGGLAEVRPDDGVGQALAVVGENLSTEGA